MSEITPIQRSASLEALVESGDLGLQLLHPGGLEMTRELAEMCRVTSGKMLLDVACGTGESACYLAQRFGCSVTGVDHSAFMIDAAIRKAQDRKLKINFQQADAHSLPFAAETFDAVISECTICALEKERAIREMVRVAKSGGWVGISDLYWKEHAPSAIKRRLAEIEEERPENLAGWIHLFESAGLQEVHARDQSESIRNLSKETRTQLGIRGYIKVMLKIVRRWGIGGIRRVLGSERTLRSEHLGYAIIAGQKPNR
jgi:ubiquinone/menaquinone biosynthesis C-methylase UbiE